MVTVVINMEVKEFRALIIFFKKWMAAKMKTETDKVHGYYDDLR